jgi:DNA modification methylase
MLFHQDESVTLHQGNTLEVLKGLASESVQCCATSPPYWGLRDYGLPPSIWDGDAECEHDWGGEIRKDSRGLQTSPSGTIAGPQREDARKSVNGQFCMKCRAWRGCFGLEPTPELYVEHTVQIFREVRRVLRKDGVLFFNIGDSYNAGRNGGHPGGKKQWKPDEQKHPGRSGSNAPGLKPKDLCGIPWRVAFALQADGWYLRQDCIWHKPSCMPSSVTDRCTTAHEYLFLLSKSERYYFDAEAIKEPAVQDERRAIFRGGAYVKGSTYDNSQGGRASVVGNIRIQPTTRNRRSVWTIATKPYKGAHFATFPPQLIEPCILAGTSEYGCCPSCGAPWKRRIEKQTIRRDRPADMTQRHLEGNGVNSCGNTVAGVKTVTTGWDPTCVCLTEYAHAMPVPCTVLDPFVGSGTTCMVSNWLGRKSIGIDLSETYLRDHALVRIKTPRPKVKTRKESKCQKQLLASS